VAFRGIPRIGDTASMVQLGMRRAVHVVAVDGRTLVVREEAGDETTFVLNELTGHWVRQGDPYYGVRLMLHPGAAD